MRSDILINGLPAFTMLLAQKRVNENLSDLISALTSTLIVSLLSLGGIFALSLKESTLHSILFVLVAFSAGSILGAAYFDLVPEATELVEEGSVFVYITLGFVLFFFMERFIYWYHGHGHESDISGQIAERAATRGFAYLNLVGDGVNNFIDGMVIAASYLSFLLSSALRGGYTAVPECSLGAFG